MKILYKKILEILSLEETKDIFREKGLVPPQYIDIDRGQYIDPQKFDLITYPAIFYRWTTSLDNNPLKKIGELNITISVIYEDFLRTSSIDNINEDAFKFFDFLDTLIVVLRDIETEKTGKLILVNEGMQTQNEEDISVFQIQFKCSFKDDRYKDNFKSIELENINLDNDNQKKSGFF